MNDQPRKKPPFPRAPLLAAGLAIGVSLAAAAVGRATGAADSTPHARPLMSRDLLFRDDRNGAVSVFDAHHPATPIETVAPETNGFLRAAMRGLAQQRLRQDEGASTPFHLTYWADGRLTLDDPATGRRLEMEAFGETNEKAFASLLTAEAPRP